MGSIRPHFIFFIVLLVPLFLHCSGDPCTNDDYVAEYTQCKQDNTHNLVYYKKPQSTCTDGVTLPSPIFNLPCNITCEDGQFLGVGETTCTNCTAGYFNRGASVYIDSWYEWPSEFSVSSYCVGTYDDKRAVLPDCPGWSLNDFYIRSADTNDSQISVLDIRVNLLTEGHVHFSFLADAEAKYDGLNFYIDGNKTLNLISSTAGVFQDYTAPLDAGFHLLRFEYYKDFSVSNGLDAVLIQILDIAGVYYPWDTVCFPCSPGEYAGESGSDGCHRCPLNSFVTGEAATACTACGATEFAYPGSEACSPRPACTADDYVFLSSKTCSLGSPQAVTATWLDPHICDSTAGVSLPADRTQTCAACDPGFFRNGTLCAPCPSGTAVGGGGSASCQQCPAGTAAVRSLSLTKFDYWPNIASTGCTGLCSTDGWRLRSNYIDAGVGHGVQVQSWFQLDVTFEAQGYLYFEHYLNCSKSCRLSFYDPYTGSATGVTFVDELQRVQTTIFFERGPHQLRWTFLKSGEGSFNDTAYIYNVTVSPVRQGGAPVCASCPSGSVSSAGSTICRNCSAGQQRDPTGTVCVACSGNTYNPTPGAGCLPCLPGTVASADGLSCLSPCQLTTVDAVTNANLTYDFRPLTAAGRVLGPLDNTIFKYYINICQHNDFNGVCFDDDGYPLDTFVCQYDTVVKFALNLGTQAAYYPLPNGTRGIQAQYTGGELGCPKYYGNVPQPRKTNLYLICDPLAGLGTLAPSDVLESPPCVYHFEVRTAYACPACIEQDYGHYYTVCQNGYTTKVYYWLDTPPLCTGGLSLPPPEQVPCEHSTVPCSAGQYLDEGSAQCTSCTPGTFSVGGGEVVKTWPTGGVNTPLPAPFSTFCTGAGCTAWFASGAYVSSGTGDSSLVANYDLVQAGSVTFKYKVYSAKDGVFAFVIDGQSIPLNAKGVSSFGWTTYISPQLSTGRHVLTWRYTGGNHGPPGTLGLEGAVVDDVVVLGTDYHSGACIPCPAGTYSSSGASDCLPCPVNTISQANADVCTPCPNGTYSLGGVGATTCLPSVPCTNDNYEKVYGLCRDGITNVTFQPLAPFLCTPTYTPAPVPTACGDCPSTLYWTDHPGQCVSCELGQFYFPTTSSCADIPVGFVAIKHEYYFIQYYSPDGVGPFGGKRDVPTLPEDFSTGCSGGCVSAGWRANGEGVDSGYHGNNAVDSFLSLSPRLTRDGSISFSYSIHGDISALSGLQLQVDNLAVPIETPYQGEKISVTIPLEAGSHTITWNYHQNSGDTSFARIYSVEVVGSFSGAIEAAPCPAGQANPELGGYRCLTCTAGSYSGQEGSTTCDVCAPNTFAAFDGATSCLPCPPGTQAPGNTSTYCATKNCVFTNGAATYDLSSLGGEAKGPVSDHSGNVFYFNVCYLGSNTSACPGSHVCVKQGGVVTSNGGTIGFYAAQNVSSGSTYFSLRYEDGASTTCVNDSLHSTTVLDFECDTQLPDNLPQFISTDDDTCISYFSWRTQLGCPLCGDSDYLLDEGPCDGQNKALTKIRTGICNGPATVPLPSEACTIPVAFPLAALLVPLLAFIVLLVVAVVMFLRHRKIAKQYSLLLNNRDRSVSLSTEMHSPLN